MKKLLALLLSVITVFSLAACSNQDDDDDDDRKSEKKPATQHNAEVVPFEEEQLPAEPTAEEQDALRQYYYLCQQLFYLETDVSQERLQSLYQQLLDAESLDHWIHSEYGKTFYENEFGNPDIITDRQTLLNKFTVMDDVLLHYRKAAWTDNLGNLNTRDSGNTFWDYNADGEVCRIQNESFYIGDFGYRASDLRFDVEYDAEGKPLCKRYYLDNDSILYMVVYTYNENGLLTEEEYRQNTSSEYVYHTYDENGRLIQTTWKNIFHYALDYTYDEAGRLASETITVYSTRSVNKTQFPTSRKVRTYTYDEQGNLQGGTFSETEYYNTGKNISSILDGQLSFEHDENGRLLTETRTYNSKVTYPDKDSGKTIPHTVSSETYEYTYGTYYIYIG